MLAVERKFFDAVGGDDLRELSFNHLARVGARGVEYGAAGAIDGAGIFAIEWANVRVGGIGGIHVGEAFPAFADADDGATELAGAVDYGLDDWVQAGNVAAAGEDGDFIFCGHWDQSPCDFLSRRSKNSMLTYIRSKRLPGLTKSPQAQWPA